MIFGIKDHFDPYNVLLAIATNIPVLLMTAFVLQGHIYICVFCSSGPREELIDRLKSFAQVSCAGFLTANLLIRWISLSELNIYFVCSLG